MEKLCFINFQILIVSSTFASNFFDLTAVRIKIRFLGETLDPPLLTSHTAAKLG